MAEGVGFEPTVRFRTPVFKTGALNRSATLPAQYAKKIGVVLSLLPFQGPQSDPSASRAQ